MKVLDPQAALLTTAEVNEFLQSQKPRAPEKKIGSYPSVNLKNYSLVRQDLEAYIRATTPFILNEPPPESWMTDLILKLKKYQLYKTEVFALINLGIGRDKKGPAAGQGGEAQPEANGEAAEGENEEEGDEKEELVKEEEENGEEEEEEAQNNVDLMLFELIVEDSDERFPGDKGQQQISEILGILRDTIATHEKTNGNAMNGA